MKGVKNPSGRLSRWLLFLDQFTFTIEYIHGIKNSIADHRSRNHEILTMQVIFIQKIIKESHALTGHAAANATYNFIKKQYEVTPKFKEVVQFIDNCKTCMKYRNNKSLKLIQ